MINKFNIRRLVYLLGFVLLAGCAGITYQYDVSMPTIDKNNFYISEKGVANFNDFQIMVRPAYRVRVGDEYTKYKPAQYQLEARHYGDSNISPNSIYIEILIKAKEEGVQFDPSQVFLMDSGDKRYTSSRIVGPMRPYSLNNYVLPLCHQGTLLETDWGYGVALKPSAEYCFALRFDKVIEQDMDFFLQINGITNSIGRVILPVIRFKTKRIENYES